MIQAVLPPKGATYTPSGTATDISSLSHKILITYLGNVAKYSKVEPRTANVSLALENGKFLNTDPSFRSKPLKNSPKQPEAIPHLWDCMLRELVDQKVRSIALAHLLKLENLPLEKLNLPNDQLLTYLRTALTTSHLSRVLTHYMSTLAPKVSLTNPTPCKDLLTHFAGHSPKLAIPKAPALNPTRAENAGVLIFQGFYKLVKRLTYTLEIGPEFYNEHGTLMVNRLAKAFPHEYYGTHYIALSKDQETFSKKTEILDLSRLALAELAEDDVPKERWNRYTVEETIKGLSLALDFYANIEGLELFTWLYLIGSKLNNPNLVLNLSGNNTSTRLANSTHEMDPAEKKHIALNILSQPGPWSKIQRVLLKSS